MDKIRKRFSDLQHVAATTSRHKENLLLRSDAMTEERYKEMRKKLDDQFSAAEAEYRKNIEALERVMALERLMPPETPPEPPTTSAIWAEPSLPEDNEPDDPLAGIGLNNEDVEQGQARRGAVLSAVRSVLERLPAQFTWREVSAEIRRHDPQAVFQDHSVRQAMTKCADAGLLELVRQGTGRAPSIYRRRTVFDVAAAVFER